MKISGSILYWLFLILICALRPVSFLLVDVEDVNTSYGNSIEFIEDLNVTENSDKLEYIDPSLRDEMPSTKEHIEEDRDNTNTAEIHSSFTDSSGVPNTDEVLQSDFRQIMSEGLSQNSGALNEFSDTGQVLLTIVDTAGAELKSTAELTKSQSDVPYKDQQQSLNQSHSTLPSHNVPLIPIKHSTSNLSDNNDNLDDNEIFRNISLEDDNVLNVDLSEGRIDGTQSQNLENATGEDEPKIEVDDNITETATLKDESTVVLTPKPQDKEDIPSFAEWAQKQLEEAEKKKEIQNTSFQNNQNNRNNGRSTSNIKLRSKNYASPDCGAKIVAANAEATSPSLVLSPSKDEYMLNTCNSRIWFIVELCEAVQAKRVELANFELFSSTPKDFSVYVSDRFPTRDWSSVGQFVAKDERDVQMYDLQPHIFGKYVKVELNSHYGSEHYCPISLFRLYGTSEYEVLETEDDAHHSIQDSDDDDEFVEEPLSSDKGEESSYLFGSAREVVMSFVKKAAQVLVMTSDSTNRTTQRTVDCNLPKLPITEKCQTPSHLIVCDNCSDLFFGNVYSLLSCRNSFLKQISDTTYISNAITRSDICTMYGLNFSSKETSCYSRMSAKVATAFFGPEYIVALCNILAIKEKKVVLNSSNSLFSNLIENGLDDIGGNQNNTESQLNNVIKDDQILENDQTINQSNVPINSDPQSSVFTVPDIHPTKTLKDTDNDDSVTKSEIHVESSESLWQTTTSEVENIQITETDVVVVPTDVQSESPPVSTSSSVKQSVDEIPVQGDEKIPDNGDGYEIVQEFDSFLSEWEQYPSNNNPVTTTPITPPSSLPQGQKESVFVRLFNRIKALERNMSLSSQYLEELSRRYKKQMEEMQRAFDQTLAIVKEESKKSEDFREQYSETQNRINSQLSTLTNAVEILMAERNSWANAASWFMHFFITQLFIVTIVLYFCGKSDTRKYNESSSEKPSNTNEVAIPKRRKSVDVVRHESPAKRRRRRPSEEALNITGTYNDLLIPDVTEVDNVPWQLSKADKRRKRKKNSILRRSSSNSALSTRKHLDIVSTHSYDLVTKQNVNFNFKCNSTSSKIVDVEPSFDEVETRSVESSVSTTSDKRSDFDSNVISKLISPLVMKTAMSERKKRYSFQDNSSIEAAAVAAKKDSTKRVVNIQNEKSTISNGVGRSSSITSTETISSPKKEKKSGGLKKIFKKVF